MLSERILSALKAFYALTQQDPSITWVLSGSVSLVIQGVEIIPSDDIDILTDKDGATRLDNLLKDFVVKKSEYSGTTEYQSYFGIYKIQNIQVDVMGEMQYRQKDGSWSELNQNHEVIYREFEGMRLPMLSLEQELEEYQQMGRMDKVEKIQETLNKR